jgi:hypothetical protein
MHPLTGKSVRVFGGGYMKASECDAAEPRAIDELKKPAHGEMPTFDDWFHYFLVTDGPSTLTIASGGKLDNRAATHGRQSRSTSATSPL